MIVVLDCGSQYTQLIAKRLRALGFQSEVISGKTKASQVKSLSHLKGIIISGSPLSVGSSWDPDPELFNLGLPLLGICFGYQFLAKTFGGKVEAQIHREYGAATVEKTPAGSQNPLTRALSPSSRVWMSHGDSVTSLPPKAEMLLTSSGQASCFWIPEKKLWGLQFHPEVHHSEEGDKILRAFAEEICRHQADWDMKSALQKTKDDLKTQLAGVPEVLCGVSGGVDSTVMAVLLSQVTKVRALFVDHGFLRSYDLRDLRKIFSHYPNIQLEVIEASKNFWKELKGVSDPEQKRKIMGRLFIETFDEAVHDHQRTGEKIFLGQGTIYSDVIESAANELAPAEKIKSHHNVGGLPDSHGFVLVEPLRRFFKDEVRTLGALLGIEASFLNRHPFPGPGLSIRCVGDLEPEKIEMLRRVDDILHQELISRNLYDKTWQAAAVLLPVRTVGVMGDGRSYDSVVALRLVSSIDAMTAEASDLPFHDLKEIASKIINQVKGVNRVVYDLTSKPPGTIEWE